MIFRRAAPVSFRDSTCPGVAGICATLVEFSEFALAGRRLEQEGPWGPSWEQQTSVELTEDLAQADTASRAPISLCGANFEKLRVCRSAPFRHLSPHGRFAMLCMAARPLAWVGPGCHGAVRLRKKCP